MLTLIALLLLSYLAGSIPGSLWVGKWIYGVDLRQHGSGNPGATNAYRVLGWKAGLLSTVIDMGKGLAAAGLIAGLRLDPLPSFLQGEDGALLLPLVAGAAAVFGHMFPVWARFKGGKGVNTSAGVLIAITPLNVLIVFITFCLVLWATRFVSLSSIIAATMYPVSLLVQRFVFDAPVDSRLIFFAVLLALAIVLAHHSNIRRLIKGTENRISSYKKPVSIQNSGDR
jgi:glycerol-3-phosphate acyltransferase PlsY